jgi:hypothetical protein
VNDLENATAEYWSWVEFCRGEQMVAERVEPVDHINERDQRLFDLREHFRKRLESYEVFGDASISDDQRSDIPLSKEDLQLLVEVLTDGI